MIRLAQRSTFFVRCLLWAGAALLLVGIRGGHAQPSRCANPGGPLLSIEPTKYVGEGNDPATVTVTLKVTLSQYCTDTVTVQYATQDNTALAGSDYTFTADTLTFPPGSVPADLVQYITVPILNDTVEESLKSFYVDLSNPQNASIGTCPPTGRCEVTIIDDDGTKPTVQFDQKDYNLSKNAGPVKLWVSLSAMAPVNVTVTYQTYETFDIDGVEAGLDFTTTGATVTFLVGEISKPIEVPIINDSITEANEYFLVELSAGATLGSVNPATVTIIDDDPPAPAVQFVSDSFTVGENEGTAWRVGAGRKPITETDRK